GGRRESRHGLRKSAVGAAAQAAPASADVEELRRLLAAKEDELARVTRHAELSVSRGEEQLDLLRSQAEALLEQLQAREAELETLRQAGFGDLAPAPEGSPERELAELREELANRDAQIGELQARLDEALNVVDPAQI